MPLKCEWNELTSRDESNETESRCGDIEREAFDNGDVGTEEISGPCGLNNLEGAIAGMIVNSLP